MQKDGITERTPVRLTLAVLIGVLLSTIGFVSGYYRARDAERAWTQAYVRSVLNDEQRVHTLRMDQFVTRAELVNRLARIEARLVRIEVGLEKHRR